VIIADTSGLLALYNKREPTHTKVARSVTKSPELLVVSPYVVAELDYLAATRLGLDTELTILRELGSGAYELPSLDADALNRCAEVIERYSDQTVGVTDASLVVLAHRYNTRTILTLDHRHFEVLRPLDGGRFKLVPS
jgi:predicted nucleic acid-binding protein